LSIRDLIQNRYMPSRRTLLGAGPMSTNVIDAIIAEANSRNCSIALIPSRRQIEAAELGGGYVNNWSTEEFVKYVRERDKRKLILLSRDHSGPWQYKEADSMGNPMNYLDAMRESKFSLQTDIEQGFDMLHIDPSKGFNYGRTEEEVEADIIELVSFCVSVKGFKAEFEVGADEQSHQPDVVSIAEEKLQRILNAMKKLKLPLPVFYVLQTGTKVQELRNVGSFDSKFPVRGMLPPSVQLPEIIRMCERNGVFLKEHNADYLSQRALDWHRRFGIHATNVAPEFGTVETKAMLDLAKSIGDSGFIDYFSNLVLEGGKWRKWMVPDSHATETEKVIIAGHYHFAEFEFLEQKERLVTHLNKRGLDFNAFVLGRTRESLAKYLDAFGHGN